MTECQALDRLITPYVDDECSERDRGLVRRHLLACPLCRARVDAESAARDLLRRHAAAARRLGETPAWRPRAFRLGKPPLVAAHPAALSGGVLAALLLVVVALRPQPVAAVGVIGDSTCGVQHVYSTPLGDSQPCTLRCVARGAHFVLIANGQVYHIENQGFPNLAAFADRRVTVSGHFDGPRLQLASMALAGQ